MGQQQTNRKKDYLLRRNQFDTSPILTSVDIKRSIMDMRRVYHTMTDHDFAKMYHDKYRVATADVLRVLEVNS